MTPTANIPVAPAGAGPQGTSTPGPHYQAFRDCRPFDLSASLRVTTGTNPWRPNSPGNRFYAAVLAKNPKTVADAIALGKDAGFKAREVQGHLRWIYTWSYLEVNGKVFSPPTAPAAPKAEKAKGKSKSKVSA